MPLPERGSYAELVARANSNSHFETERGTPPARKPTNKRVQKLLKQLMSLPPQTRERLCDVLKGTRKLHRARNELFAYIRCPSVWSIVGFEEDSKEHFVAVDGSACSCPDHKFRKRVCKHMECIRAITT